MSPTAVLILFAGVASAKWSSFCPLRCRCNDAELTVNCQDASLDVFPVTLHPMLKEIRLSRNNIGTIHSAIGVYSQLEVVDLSANRISELGEDSFALAGLREVDLSFNFIKALDAKTFRGAENLQVLILKRNLLSELQPNAFSELKNLEVLDLSNNHISAVNPSAFTGLENIKKVILRGNHFRAVPTESFIYLDHLKSLDLGSNALSMVDEAAFYHLACLEELELDKCGIAQIDPAAFTGLRELKSLNLQYNNIQSFPKAIGSLETLEKLIIGGNLITRLSAKDLRNSYRLKRFSLSYSEMFQKIDEDAFQFKSQLEEVTIEFNMQLESLPMNLFGGLPSLRHISLRGNGIRHLDPHLLPVEMLDSFDVSKNPLECDCDLLWLWKHLQQDLLYHNSSLVRCAGPSRVRDELLRNLDEGELDCGGDAKRGFLVAALTLLSAVLILVGGFMLWYRRKASSPPRDPIKTLKQMETSASLYAQYQDSKYPYVLQPTVIQNLPTANVGYAGLTPRGLPSYLVNLPRDTAKVDTSNHIYQTLRSSMSSASESDSAQYFTLGSDKQSSLYV